MFWILKSDHWTHQEEPLENEDAQGVIEGFLSYQEEYVPLPKAQDRFQ